MLMLQFSSSADDVSVLMLQFQLQQQMTRHNEMMESARKKSDETIDHLKLKLNSLQEVSSEVACGWLERYQIQCRYKFVLREM